MLDKKVFLVTLINIFVATSTVVNAQSVDLVTDSNCENFVDLESLNQNSSEPVIEDATTKENIALAGISLPNLWWAREQFDPFNGRLVNNWLAYPQLKQIDLTVNWQLWTLLDYLSRYRFINQFGTAAREYGYSLRIINQQKQCLATYHYESDNNPPKWEIRLDNSGEDSLQIEPTN